jgi:predicted TIM-barrel fold metal-dependent hydrolase
MHYQVFDADSHYYEPDDAFTRYASERMIAKGFPRWLVESDGTKQRKRIAFGNGLASAIRNPLFDPITPPGAYHERLKVLESGERPPLPARGEPGYVGLIDIPPESRDRDLRLKVMDHQNVERTFLFPTLTVTVEGLISDQEMLYECLHSFNRWLEEDWGFAHQNRIYAVPHISLADVDLAVKELDWVIERGARAIGIRPGPAFGRSPAEPYFDPFWARVNDAELLVTCHAWAGPTAYSDEFARNWARPPVRHAEEAQILEAALFPLERPVMDTLIAMVVHNLFGRFPKIRVASIEMGSAWVPYLLHLLDHVHSFDSVGFFERKIRSFGATLDRKPSEIFLDHVWISPFPEEDIPALVSVIGDDHVLMGSDWPHPEGTPEPLDYRARLEDLSEDSIKKIMRDNALKLIGPR